MNTSRAMIALGLLSVFSPLLSSHAAGVSKPNFILIVTDDQGYQDLGCYGSSNIKTPNIDRMAAEGVRFTDFYVSGPKCVPSRFSLMTGCYPPKVDSPLPLFYGSPFGINPGEILISELLQENGYATGLVGKWHLGSRPMFHPNRHGFDLFFGLLSSNDHRNNQPPLFRQEVVIENPVDQNTLTQRYTAEALKFISNHQNKPFFLYLAHAMPHKPLHVSKAFRGKSERGLYGDTIEEIDWSTGQILKTLKELDLDKNTLVLFLSDNGPWLELGDRGGCALPLRGGKLSTYEGGVRVPFIAWGPGIFGGGDICREIAIGMDIYPTLAAIAGLTVPESQNVDGVSMLDLLRDPQRASSGHEFILYFKDKQLIAIRKGCWKYHWPTTLKEAFHPEGELYDLESDIGESKNLVRLRQNLAGEMKALGESANQRINRDYRPGARSEEPLYVR